MMKELSFVVLFLAAFTVLFVDGVLPKDDVREAILDGDEQKLLDLLANGTDINKCLDSWDRTPLSLAIWREKEEIALLLIEKGADLNVSCAGRQYHSPLADAASMDMKTLVKVLVDKGVHIDDDILWEALLYDKSDFLELFIQNGIDPNKQFGDCNKTCLFWVVLNGNVNVTKLLLKKGADIEHKDCEDNTPLNGVCWSRNCHSQEEEDNQERGMEFLIESGANVNTADNIYKKTPLMCAVWWNSTILVEKLIEKGADVNAKDIDNQTALHRVDSTDIAAMLIKKGADVNAMDKEGNTPWSSAIENRNENVAKFLLDHGADIHKGEALRKKTAQNKPQLNDNTTFIE